MHLPVLLKETLFYLQPQPNENFIDATFGEGGHSKAILEKIKPQGKLLALEIDPALYQLGKRNYKQEEHLILVNSSYANLEQITREKNFRKIKGVLFDLGLCSWHIDESKRGFSFHKDEPLDMRFNPQQELTAFEIVNYWPYQDLVRILKEYGEEKYALRIAKAITEKRKKNKITTTQELVQLLREILPHSYDNFRLHFATRTFQALRIAVNKELDNLKIGLQQAWKVLSIEGRIVVISFHSLEDRIVKQFFQQLVRKGEGTVLTKKPVRPTLEEIKNNPRSSSAKLRAIEKLKGPSNKINIQ